MLVVAQKTSALPIDRTSRPPNSHLAAGRSLLNAGSSSAQKGRDGIR